MLAILSELWRDEADGRVSMMPIVRESDLDRRATMQKATLVHSFSAASDFEAFEKYYEWNGLVLTPETGWSEHVFADEEAAEQQRYLRERDG